MKGPGWPLERASSHLAAISPEIFRSTVASGLPSDVAQAYVESILKAFPGSTGVSGTVREEYETPLWVLLAVAGVVLIIASANIATLSAKSAHLYHDESEIVVLLRVANPVFHLGGNPRADFVRWQVSSLAEQPLQALLAELFAFGVV